MMGAGPAEAGLTEAAARADPCGAERRALGLVGFKWEHLSGVVAAHLGPAYAYDIAIAPHPVVILDMPVPIVLAA